MINIEDIALAIMFDKFFQGMAQCINNSLEKKRIIYNLFLMFWPIFPLIFFIMSLFLGVSLIILTILGIKNFNITIKFFLGVLISWLLILVIFNGVLKINELLLIKQISICEEYTQKKDYKKVNNNKRFLADTLRRYYLTAFSTGDNLNLYEKLEIYFRTFIFYFDVKSNNYKQFLQFFKDIKTAILNKNSSLLIYSIDDNFETIKNEKDMVVFKKYFNSNNPNINTDEGVFFVLNKLIIKNGISHTLIRVLDFFKEKFWPIICLMIIITMAIMIYKGQYAAVLDILKEIK